MGKKAVLVGINYPGTKAELKGCLNDVTRIRKVLLNRYGFSEGDITILIDTDKNATQPTGKNIRNAISGMINNAKPGDFLFVHYSGHGTRLPSEGDETGYDECIVPSDMNLITDDDFRAFVDQIPEGCRITIVFDSCHSGGLIDGTKEQIGESTLKMHHEPESDSRGMGTSRSLGRSDSSTFGVRNFFKQFTSCGFPIPDILMSKKDREMHGADADAEGEGEMGNNGLEMKSKSLPVDDLVHILRERTGNNDIEVGKIRNHLFDVFGEDASPQIKAVAQAVVGHLVKQAKAEGGVFGMVGNLAEEFLIPQLGETEDPKSGCNNPGRGAGDNGILISGCQTFQTSADACPSGNAAEAYGALSNAIQTILSESSGDVTNYDLITKVRKILQQQRFTQRPGLYCSDHHVQSPFIC